MSSAYDEECDGDCKNCDEDDCEQRDEEPDEDSEEEFEETYRKIQCPECKGTGIWIGAFIGGAPNYFGLQNPSKIPCSICNGRGTTYISCSDAEEDD